MTASVLMQAPIGSGISGEIVGAPSGTTYFLNSIGQILAAPQDVSILLGMGLQVLATGLTPGPAYNVNSTMAATTLTAGNLTGGDYIVLGLTGTLATAAALTLPTVASLAAALPNPQVSQDYRLRIINFGNSNTWTVTANAGWTLNGAMGIATLTWREFIVTVTSLTTATLQNIGAGMAP
jgi:hypothetical protein